MDELLTHITQDLLQGKSVVLVGKTQTGKTFWVENALTPYLEISGKRVIYLKDGDEKFGGRADVLVCDEVETLFDQKYLQGDSAEPYYTDTYLEKVGRWHKNYANFPPATLFIITRNTPDSIKNLVQHFHRADWDGRELAVYPFET